MSDELPFKVGDRVRMTKEWGADVGDDPIGSVVGFEPVAGKTYIKVQWDGGPLSDYAAPVLKHAED